MTGSTMTVAPAMSAAPTLAVVGAGPIGRASAALVAAATRGPLDGRSASSASRVALWSPSGASTRDLQRTGEGVRLRATGALDTTVEIGLIGRATELAAFDVLLIAIPGNAYSAVLPSVVDALRPGQAVIVSGALSMAPVWLHEHAKARGVEVSVVSWGTSLCTARRVPEAVADVAVGSIRSRFEMATIPAAGGEAAHALCTRLFGDRFNRVDNLLATLLSNVNPVAHAAEVLPNLTRIECAEDWPLFQYLTPAAARIGEAIDAERIAIARAFGLEVRSVHEHTHLSYHVPMASYGEMAAAVHAKVGSPPGPKSFEHRYLVEDVPYGLVFFEALGELCGVPTRNISGAITLLSSACQRDFRSENRLLGSLRLADETPESLLRRCLG